MRAKEQDQAVRALWQEQAQTLPFQQLVFLDECGVNATMHQRYGRAPR